MAKRFVIIDGHHLMYRAYWAIPRHMRTSGGKQVNAVFGVASMLLQILKTEEPDYLLFCFDAGDQTFRHTEYKEYKSGRAETPDDFYEQIPEILKMVSVFGFKGVSDPGFEADDFACAYARLGEREGMQVYIVSGDRDLLQLVSESVRVVVPHKGYQAAEYIGPKEVVAKYGVTPGQITSYKGLVGDSSDNLSGVKGIGPKAAAALLQQHGSMEAVYAHLAEIKPAWRTKLEAGREQAFFCERMSQLVCDMPLPYSMDQLKVAGISTDDILSTFNELEFILLTRRLSLLASGEFGKKAFIPSEKEIALADSRHLPAANNGLRQSESPQLSLL